MSHTWPWTSDFVEALRDPAVPAATNLYLLVAEIIDKMRLDLDTWAVGRVVAEDLAATQELTREKAIEMLALAALRLARVANVFHEVPSGEQWSHPLEDAPASATTVSMPAMIRLSEVEPKRPPWSHFPHCPNVKGCNKRLWAANGQRRSDDPRGPLVWPTSDGRCPHCSTDLHWNHQRWMDVERERITGSRVSD